MTVLLDRRARTSALALAALVAAVFLPVVNNEFILFDDLTYVVNNPHLGGGLSPGTIRWAFTETYASNWSPLTWLSHALDVVLFGLDPRGHHLVNVLLHAANTALLFLALRGLTGRTWTSLLAATLFGVHPLRVESVAWVSCRKDVLSGLFWMLAVIAYCRYARRPRCGRYLTVAALFALGLMAKPSVVTFPFALLLLDAWPLGRLGWLGAATVGETPARPSRGRFARCLLEKVPLLLLTAASGVLTYRAQASWGAMDYLRGLTLADRLGNAFNSYLDYLGKTLWPQGLAIYYPHPGQILFAGKVAAALLFLAVASALAVACGRRRPWLATGWFWYLGTMIPMIGLVQVGAQSSADRYTYLPHLGVAVLASWEAAAAVSRRPRFRPGVVLLSLVAVVALATVSRVQTTYWKDDVAVFGHAVAVTRENWLAQLNLGAAWGMRGEHRKAREHFAAALRIRPDYPMARENLRKVEEVLGRPGAAAPGAGGAPVGIEPSPSLW